MSNTEEQEKHRPRVFISYAREDRESARRLYSQLKSKGALPWLDSEDLLPGDDWQRAIRVAIEKSNFFVALLSQKSVNKKGYVQRELRQGLAVLEEIPEGQTFVIPARLEECSPSHLKLHELHWVDLFPSWEERVERILLALEIRTKSSFKQATVVKGAYKLRPRIQLDLSRVAFSRLEGLKAELGAASEAEVMRQALQLLEFLAREQKEGHSVTVDRGGKSVKLMISG
jgi:hypothetical protein